MRRMRNSCLDDPLPWGVACRCSSDMGTPHPRITSELGMAIGGPHNAWWFGDPLGPKALGIWGPHSDMGTPHTQKLDDDYVHFTSL